MQTCHGMCTRVDLPPPCSLCDCVLVRCTSRRALHMQRRLGVGCGCGRGNSREECNQTHRSVLPPAFNLSSH
jgi:hypothetical protein